VMGESVLETLSANVRAMRKWGVQGGTSILDQGVLSGTNFVINILLARWLSPAGYGAFAVAFALFLFLSGFHNAVILEPMSVFGPAAYADHLRAYFRGQLRISLVSTSLGGLVLVGVGFALGRPGGVIDPAVGSALTGVGVAMPLILFMWLTRRYAYVAHDPPRALAGSCLYMFGALPAVVLLRQAGALSPFSGYMIMGGASLVSALYVSRIWLLGGPAQSDRHVSDWRRLVKEQWGYGKWISAASVLSAAGGQVQTVMLGFIALSGAAVLRAMQNFTLPMAQAITSISILGLPFLAESYGRGEVRGVVRRGMVLTLLLFGAALAYEVVLLALHQPLELLLYEGKFAEYSWMIPLLGLVPVFSAFSTGYSLILRAARWPEHYLVVAGVAAAGGLTSMIVFTRAWGVWGTAASVSMSYLCGLVATYALFRHWSKSTA
jgi:O-antigen/teichoic acid export membrane protein